MNEVRTTYDCTVYEYAREGEKLPDKTIRKLRKRKLYEIIAAMCEVPEDVVGSIPVFVLRGQHEMEVTGCSGVREYSEKTIILALGKELFTITGDALELTDFRDNVLYIRGNIAQMRFGAGEEDASC